MYVQGAARLCEGGSAAGPVLLPPAACLRPAGQPRHRPATLRRRGAGTGGRGGHEGTAIMMFFKKMIVVHGYIGVKINSKTLL